MKKQNSPRVRALKRVVQSVILFLHGIYGKLVCYWKLDFSSLVFALRDLRVFFDFFWNQ